MHRFDVVIIGAGAAGLFCAGAAGQLGVRVLLLDHRDKVAEKIRISGGGRCNFTNTDTGPANFLGDNPRFCRSALSRYAPRDFTELLQRHRIGFHEKHRGQLFCDRSAQDLIDMLLAECAAGGVAIADKVGFQAGSRVAQRGADDLLHLSGVEIDAGAEACHEGEGGPHPPRSGACALSWLPRKDSNLE